MLISELSFPHLQAAHEASLARELERRRVVEERRADAAATRGEPRRARREHRRATPTRPSPAIAVAIPPGEGCLT